MLGSGYVIEHCVAAFSREKKAETYQVYVANCLRLSAMGLITKSMTYFYDLIHPKPIDNRDSKEIINDITTRAGLKVVNRE